MASAFSLTSAGDTATGTTRRWLGVMMLTWGRGEVYISVLEGSYLINTNTTIVELFLYNKTTSDSIKRLIYTFFIEFVHSVVDLTKNV